MDDQEGNWDVQVSDEVRTIEVTNVDSDEIPVNGIHVSDHITSFQGILEGQHINLNELTMTQMLEILYFCEQVENDAFPIIWKCVAIPSRENPDLRTPSDLISLNSSTRKMKEHIFFLWIPIASLSDEVGPSRPKRVVKPTSPLRSPYYKTLVDSSESTTRLEEKAAGSIFVVTRNLTYVLLFW